MNNAIEQEPVGIAGAIMALVQSAIIYLTVSGHLSWTDETSTAFVQMLENALPFLLTGGNFLIGILIARWQVVPEAKVETMVQSAYQGGKAEALRNMRGGPSA